MSADPNVIIGAATAAGGIATFFWGLHTYRQNSREAQELKKKETLTDIILPLISEYNNTTTMQIAMNILDDKAHKLPTMIYEPGTGQRKRRYDDGYIYKEQLTTALRDHNVLYTLADEDTVRDSFDSLLGFFAKLEYIIRIGLLQREDLTLFDYFINKAAENQGVRNFVRFYKHPLSGLLDPYSLA